MKEENDPYPSTFLKGYELFTDPSYYHMCAVRHIGERSFNNTSHFMTEKHAREAISFATDAKIRLLNELKDKFGKDNYYNFKGLGEFINKKLSELK